MSLAETIAQRALACSGQCEVEKAMALEQYQRKEDVE
jgi:hypothetical protein